MATTTIPAVKAALVEQLTAAGWPAYPPDISYGLPRQLSREMVIVGDSQGQPADEEWGPIGVGRKAREERYALQLAVYVMTPGQGQQEATERAFELFAVIEDLVRPNNVDLGVGAAGVLWVELAAVELLESPSDEGYEAVVSAELRVRARI